MSENRADNNSEVGNDHWQRLPQPKQAQPIQGCSVARSGWFSAICGRGWCLLALLPAVLAAYIALVQPVQAQSITFWNNKAPSSDNRHILPGGVHEFTPTAAQLANKTPIFAYDNPGRVCFTGTDNRHKLPFIIADNGLGAQNRGDPEVDGMPTENPLQGRSNMNQVSNHRSHPVAGFSLSSLPLMRHVNGKYGLWSFYEREMGINTRGWNYTPNKFCQVGSMISERGDSRGCRPPGVGEVGGVILDHDRGDVITKAFETASVLEETLTFRLCEINENEELIPLEDDPYEVDDRKKRVKACEDPVGSGFTLTVRMRRPELPMVEFIRAHFNEEDAPGMAEVKFKFIDSNNHNMPLADDVTLKWETVGGTDPGMATAGEDYGVAGSSEELSGEVTIAAGQFEATIQIPILADDDSEGRETLELKLSSDTVTFVGGVASITSTNNIVAIIDDDTPIIGFETIEVDSSEVVIPEDIIEGGESLSADVVLSLPDGVVHSETITVDYSVHSNAADISQPISDLITEATRVGTLSFPVGTRRATLTVTPAAHPSRSEDEGRSEFIVLSDPMGQHAEIAGMRSSKQLNYQDAETFQIRLSSDVPDTFVEGYPGGEQVGNKGKFEISVTLSGQDNGNNYVDCTTDPCTLKQDVEVMMSIKEDPFGTGRVDFPADNESLSISNNNKKLVFPMGAMLPAEQKIVLLFGHDEKSTTESPNPVDSNSDENLFVILDVGAQPVANRINEIAITIEDDDGIPTFSYGDIKEYYDEGGNIEIPIVVSHGPITEDVDVTISPLIGSTSTTATHGGTCDATDDDYVSDTDYVYVVTTPLEPPKTSFPKDNSVRMSTVTIQLCDDEENEPDETINVQLGIQTPKGLVVMDGRVGDNAISPITLTIRDNDGERPTVDFGRRAYNVNEGDEAAVEVTVTTKENLTNSISVMYEIVADDTTAETDDYGTPTPASPLIFEATEVNGAPNTGGVRTLTKTIGLPIEDDDLEESAQTITLMLTATGDDLGSATITKTTVITIAENDMPVIGFSQPAYEVDENAGNLEIPVTISSIPAEAITVAFTLDGTDEPIATEGTSASGADYANPDPLTLTFPAGSGDPQNIVIPIHNDSKDMDEADESIAETIVVTLDSITSGNATLDANGSETTATIVDDDSPIVVSFESESPTVTVAEDAGVASLIVTLSRAHDMDVMVDYATADGTATDGTAATGGDDYTAVSDTLTFASGQTRQAIPIQITSDDISEKDQTFSVTLSNPKPDNRPNNSDNAIILSGAESLTVTITNDDEVAFSLSGPAYRTLTSTERTANPGFERAAVYTVAASSPAEREMSVDYETTDLGGRATAVVGTDYKAVSRSTLTFDPGDRTKTFEVFTDEDAPADRTFGVLLSNAMGDGLATNPLSSIPANGKEERILSATVSFDQAVYIFAENDGVASLGVSLDQAIPIEVAVEYATTDDSDNQGDGTARAGVDYIGEDNPLEFPANSVAQTIAIQLRDNESTLSGNSAHRNFTVTLSNPTNAALGQRTRAEVIIIDDDMIKVAPSKLVLQEGGVATYRVELERPPIGSDTTVLPNSSNGDVEFDPKNLVFTEQNWNTPQFVTVTSIADADEEDDLATISHQVETRINGTMFRFEGAGTVEVKVREEDPILQPIADYMLTRANTLLSNQPGLVRFLRGADKDVHVTELQIDANTNGNSNIAVDSGFTQNCGLRHNCAWGELSGAITSTDSANSDHFFGTLGVHRRFSGNWLAGVMSQFDMAEDQLSDSRGKIDGTGWVVGPYFAARHATQSLSFEGRFLYGQTDNDIIFYDNELVLGPGRALPRIGSFDTTRWLAQFRMQGEVQFASGFRLIPYTDVGWVRDRADGFTDSLNIAVPGQAVEIRQVKLGSDIELPIHIRRGHLKVLGGIGLVLADTDQGRASSDTRADTNSRGRVNLGIDYHTGGRTHLRVGSFYDGIGTSGFESYGLSLGAEVKF